MQGPSTALTKQHLGLLLPTREVAEGSETLSGMLMLARSAEEAGIDSLWVGDSLFARPRLDPLTILSALAAITSQVRLGTAVLVAPMWNPPLLARAIATLDQVSQGRLILGVGQGPSYGPAKMEFKELGVPHTARLSRLLECMWVCRKLWTEGSEPLDIEDSRNDGEINMLPKPFQRGGPPIWLGGSGPKTLRAAAHHFDGWLPVPRSVEDFASGLIRVRSEEATAKPRKAPLAVAVYLSLCIRPTKAEAEAMLRASMETYYRSPWSRISSIQDYYSGPPEGAAEWLAHYVESGAEHLILRFSGPDILHQFQALRAHFNWK